MKPLDVYASSHELEIRLGNLLRTGVVVAANVVLVGGVIYLSRHGHEAPAYRTFRGEPFDLRTMNGVLSDSMQLHGRGIIQLGLLLLIATPIARVASAAYGFARQRDWMYVSIAAFVFSVLLYGVFASN
ncbi:MAG: DUF1634 domain-containing protein [Bryobacteraceae bacterium]|jgi:uncharacterized membrane protein